MRSRAYRIVGSLRACRPTMVFSERWRASPAISSASARFLPSGHSQHTRSEEHTSELQSLAYLVCRLLLEKKKKKISTVRLGRLRLMYTTRGESIADENVSTLH